MNLKDSAAPQFSLDYQELKIMIRKLINDHPRRGKGQVGRADASRGISWTYNVNITQFPHKRPPLFS